MLEMEEMHFVLDRDDVQKMRKEQAQAKELETQWKELHKRYKEVKAEHLERKLPQKTKPARARAKKRMLQSLVGYDERPIPEGTLTQSQAKELLPPDPGVHIWRGIHTGSRNWSGHHPPWPRAYHAWNRYTQNGAMLLTIGCLWRSWLGDNGFGEEDCPIPHLFDRTADEWEEIANKDKAAGAGGDDGAEPLGDA